MHHLDIRALFSSRFQPRVRAFAREVGDIDTIGIPEPHLPHWGSLYGEAQIRVGIIGRDTRSWGAMPEFIDAVRKDPVTALYRGKDEFDALDFTTWTNNFGTTFWDTSMKILAGIHGIEDWKRLKRQEEEIPLRSFFWANVNAVERFEVSPQENGVAWETWRKVKDAAENHLDSFRTILDVFAPHVVFIMNWDPGDHFLDFPIQWDEFGNHLAYAYDEVSGCHLLATAHPTWLNQNNLYEETIFGIIQKAKAELGIMQ